MHLYIKLLLKIASRYAPSRTLSFELVHIFKALQLLYSENHVSRSLLCRELDLGEGSVKTLLKHLKMQDLIESTKGGTKLSDRGRRTFAELLDSIPAEITIPKCSVAIGKYNCGILLRGFAFAVKSGIEQRDAAIKIGARGATTLIYKDHKFIMPGKEQNSLEKEPEIAKLLIEKLNPREKVDIVVIGSDDHSKKIAEFAAKNAGLVTIMNHKEEHVIR
jgi:hypothetical protein